MSIADIIAAAAAVAAAVFAGVVAVATVKLWLTADKHLQEVSRQTGMTYHLAFRQKFEDSMRKYTHEITEEGKAIYETEIIDLMEEACKILGGLSRPASDLVGDHIERFVRLPRGHAFWRRIYEAHKSNPKLYTHLVARRNAYRAQRRVSLSPRTRGTCP